MSAPEQPPTRPVQVKLVLLGTLSVQVRTCCAADRRPRDFHHSAPGGGGVATGKPVQRADHRSLAWIGTLTLHLLRFCRHHSDVPSCDHDEPFGRVTTDPLLLSLAGVYLYPCRRVGRRQVFGRPSVLPERLSTQQGADDRRRLLDPEMPTRSVRPSSRLAPFPVPAAPGRDWPSSNGGTDWT